MLMTRRRFLRLLSGWTAGAAIAACGGPARRLRDDPPVVPAGAGTGRAGGTADDVDTAGNPDGEPTSGRLIPRRPLGRTGLMVSILGLGGAIAVAEAPDRAERIVSHAIDLGVNYVDTAHQYGASEANIGRVMKDRRSEVVLASKTDDRTFEGTMRQFEQSLRRLQTDYLDVYQLHAIHAERDLVAALSDRGAIAAMEALRKAGAVRFIGITGHKNSEFLARALAEYPFDCVLMSLNAGDVHYDSMIRNALPVAAEREMGVIAMKVAAYDGRIFRSDGITTMREALGYTLSHPVATAIVGVASIEQLEENVAVARSFHPYTAQELQRIEDLTAGNQRAANFFKVEW